MPGATLTVVLALGLLVAGCTSRQRGQRSTRALPGMPAVLDPDDSYAATRPGRYHDEVYAVETRRGRLLARIPVGRGPHGRCIYPQPGRYSLCHTGVFR